MVRSHGCVAKARFSAAAADETFRLAWVHTSGALNQIEKTDRFLLEAEAGGLQVGQGQSFPDQALVRPPVAPVTMAHFLKLMRASSESGGNYPSVYLNQKTSASAGVNPQIFDRLCLYGTALNAARAVPSFVKRLLDAHPSLGQPPAWADALGRDGVGSKPRALPHLWLGNGQVLTGVQCTCT
jgi:hypothetical protein